MAKFLHVSKENLIYLGLWLLLYLTPVASLYFRTTSDSRLVFQWNEVFHIWTIFSIFLVIFLVHNFILATLLIYKQKLMMYLVTLVCLIAVFVTLECVSKPKHRHLPMQGIRPGEIPPGTQDMPPAAFAYPDGTAPHSTPMGDSAATTAAAPPHSAPRRQHPGNDKERFNDHMPPFFIGQAILIGVLVLVGLLGLNLGVKLYFKNEKDLHDMQKLENQNLQHQLEYLKYQINPHFFMNTLNNIHALVDIDPDKAKTTIVELSRMMRYVLYEGDKSLIPILKEVEFLRNYVRLMKLRYTQKVNVDVDIPANLSEGLIPPLLLITFLENAFKHGVSYEQESFISIIMDAEDGNLIFRCINSKKAPTKSNEAVPSEGGLGLKNIKQRLDLIYGSGYKLELNDSEKTYEVYLSIPLNAEATYKVKGEEG